MIPSVYALLLLAVAAWRAWYLVALDDLTEPIRRLVVKLPQDWKEGDRIPDTYREGLKDFIECPFCLGAWMGLAWWGAWALWPHWTLVAAVPFVISAAIIGAQKYLTSD